ncbi:MAG: PPC domain-containing protein [Caldilineales bacterium]
MKLFAHSTRTLSLVLLFALAFGGVAFAASRQGQAVLPQPAAEPTFVVSNATPIACGEMVSGNTTGAGNQVASYSCVPWWPESGPERIYSLTLAQTTSVDALLHNLSADLDLFLLGGTSPEQCLAYGDNSLSRQQLAPGQYYLVVDGFNGAAGSFQLNVWCPLAVTPTAIPTATPTATPPAPQFRRYLPLVLHSLD